MRASHPTFVFDRNAARSAGSNGGKRKNSGYLVYVDGQAWRLPDLAARLAVSTKTVRRRIARDRSAGNPLTIQGLSA